MSSPFPDKVAEAVKSLSTEMKDAVELLSKKLENAVATLGEEVERLTRMVRGSRTTIVFEVQAPTELGQSVYVVGSHGSLGHWQPALGLALDGQSYPKWTGRLEVEADTTIEYKYVRKNEDGSFTWEIADSNRAIVAASGNPAVARDEVRWS